MEIRKVQMHDISKIKSIADSLYINSEKENSDFGFYRYNLSREQYQRRSESDLFLVGMNNSTLEGFCMAYDSGFIQKLIEQEPKLKEDSIFKYLTEQEEDIVYIDQLAVEEPKSFRGSFCAYKLFQTVKEKSSDKSSIQGVITHKPWQNRSSLNFFTHLGARLVREIVGEDNITFGIYSMDLE